MAKAGALGFTNVGQEAISVFGGGLLYFIVYPASVTFGLIFARVLDFVERQLKEFVAFLGFGLEGVG